VKKKFLQDNIIDVNNKRLEGENYVQHGWMTDVDMSSSSRNSDPICDSVDRRSSIMQMHAKGYSLPGNLLSEI